MEPSVDIVFDGGGGDGDGDDDGDCGDDDDTEPRSLSGLTLSDSRTPSCGHIRQRVFLYIQMQLCLSETLQVRWAFVGWVEGMASCLNWH